MPATRRTGPNDWTVVAILAGLALIALAWGLFKWWLRRRRRGSLQAVAEQLRLTFLGDGEPDDFRGTGGFPVLRRGIPKRPRGRRPDRVIRAPAQGSLPLFGRGCRTSVRNRMAGQRDGTEVIVFDYTWHTEGRSPVAHEQTAVLMQFSRRSLPAFELRPPDWLERLFGPPPASPRASANEAFVQEYRLRCEPSGTERLISEEVIAFFADRPGWTVEGAGDRLLVYRARRLVNPDAVPELLAAALDILARFARAV